METDNREFRAWMKSWYDLYAKEYRFSGSEEQERRAKLEGTMREIEQLWLTDYTDLDRPYEEV